MDAEGDVEPGGDQLGRFLRLRRLDMGLTLKGVAEISGLSFSFISLVERGKNRPSLDSLRKLTAALHLTPMDVPVVPDEGSGRGVEMVPIPVGRSVFTIFPEGRGQLLHQDDFVRIVEIHASPGDHPEYPDRQYSHPATEVLVMKEGELEVVVGSDTTVMRTGDSLVIPSEMPHLWTPHRGIQSRFLFIQYG